MRRADWAFLVPLLLVGIVTTAGARQRAPSLRDVRHAIESASSSCRLEVEEELHMGPT